MDVQDQVHKIFTNALALKNEKKYSQSMDILETLIEICKNSQELVTKLSDVYFEYGLIMDLIDNTMPAREYFEKSYEVIKDSNDSSRLGTIQLKIGLCNAKLQDRPSDGAFLRAAEHYSHLATQYEQLKNYTGANQFHTFAEKMYILAKKDELRKESAHRGILADIDYYRDLCVVANLYNYSNDPYRAQAYAWHALSLSMDILRTTLNNGFDIKKKVNMILPSVGLCKNALLNLDDEITPVVELKINELYNMFDELTDDIPDDPEDVDLWIETHKTSLQFMFPKVLPSYLFLTSDGRLFHQTDPSNDPAGLRPDDADNTLFAGLLSAIRFAFQEQMSPVRGIIDEIKVGGDTLLIENTENITIVTITSFVYPEIRTFVKSMAKELEINFGRKIAEWIGDDQTIKDVIAFINDKVGVV